MTMSWTRWWGPFHGNAGYAGYQLQAVGACDQNQTLQNAKCKMQIGARSICNCQFAIVNLQSFTEGITRSSAMPRLAILRARTGSEGMYHPNFVRRCNEGVSSWHGGES